MPKDFDPKNPVAYDVKAKRKTILVNPYLVISMRGDKKIYQVRGKSPLSDVKSIGVWVSPDDAMKFIKIHGKKSFMPKKTPQKKKNIPMHFKIVF